MTKFSVGEKVAYYDYDRYIGEIKEIDHKDGVVFIVNKEQEGLWIHIKQVRKIKPKRKPRSVWIPSTSLPHDMICKVEDAGWISAEERKGWIEFREVVK